MIQPGENVSVTGAGTYTDPFIISADIGEEGGESGWSPGDLKMSANNVATVGWLVANGAAVSRASYAGLFAAIGVAYGPGDGSTTFNLPDLAGRFPLGADGGHPHGNIGGQETTSLTTGNLPAHSHTIAHIHSIDHSHGAVTSGFESNDHVHTASAGLNGGHTHSYLGNTGAVFKVMQETTGPVVKYLIDDANKNVTAAPDHSHVIAMAGVTANHTHTTTIPPYGGVSGGSSAANSGSVGSGDAFTNMPPWTGVTFLIKT